MNTPTSMHMSPKKGERRDDYRFSASYDDDRRRSLPWDSYRPSYDWLPGDSMNPPTGPRNSRPQFNPSMSTGSRLADSRNVTPTHSNVMQCQDGIPSTTHAAESTQTTEVLTMLPEAELIPYLKTLIESIANSACFIIEEKQSLQEVEKQAILHQRNSKYRETFPTMFEETKFRAGKAEQLHSKIKKEQDEARDRLKDATVALMSTLSQILPSVAWARNVSADLASLKTASHNMTDRKSKTGTESESIHEPLEEVRREVRRLKGNFLTETLEERLRELSNKFVTYEVHEASENKLVNLLKGVASIRTKTKELSNRLEKNETRLTRLEEALSCDMSSIKEAYEGVDSKINEAKDALEMLQNTMSKQFDDIREQSNSRRDDLFRDRDTSQHAMADIEQVLETKLETVLQIIREEQNTMTEIQMQQIQTILAIQDGHGDDITAQGETLSRHFMRNQGQNQSQMSRFPRDSTINVPISTPISTCDERNAPKAQMFPLQPQQVDITAQLSGIGHKFEEFQSFLNTLRQESMDKQAQSDAQVLSLKKQHQDDLDRLKALASELESFKNQSVVMPPNSPPSSMISHLPSIDLGVPTKENAKRKRTASPSSDESIPLISRSTNRQKQLKRMNRSTSGLS